MSSGEEFDVLVIGGGATGCGVALDSVSRGNSLSYVALTVRDVKKSRRRRQCDSY